LKNLNLAKGDIIPVLDVEFRKKMNSDKWIRENGGDFIRIVEQEIGVKPIVYCEIAYYNRYIKQKYGSQIKL
jgi:GH25 family lysozyme M1 (1,4-beta-N-acetylmuramidase)